MDRDTARALFAACEKVLSALNEAELVIQKVDGVERSLLLRSLGGAVVEVLQLRAPAVLQYPDLEPRPGLGEPDTALDADDMHVVADLTAEDVRVIDAALIAECAATPRKVARVVGFAMRNLQDRFDHVPVGYCAQRVAALAAAGLLESDGNLDHMRFSEVKLPGGEAPESIA